MAKKPTVKDLELELEAVKTSLEQYKTALGLANCEVVRISENCPNDLYGIHFDECESEGHVCEAGYFPQVRDKENACMERYFMQKAGEEIDAREDAKDDNKEAERGSEATDGKQLGLSNSDDARGPATT